MLKKVVIFLFAVLFAVPFNAYCIHIVTRVTVQGNGGGPSIGWETVNRTTSDLGDGNTLTQIFCYDGGLKHCYKSVAPGSYGNPNDEIFADTLMTYAFNAITSSTLTGSYTITNVQANGNGTYSTVLYTVNWTSDNVYLDNSQIDVYKDIQP
jgi:hypothetical protein